jgi:hypothetical protein
MPNFNVEVNLAIKARDFRHAEALANTIVGRAVKHFAPKGTKVKILDQNGIDASISEATVEVVADAFS